MNKGIKFLIVAAVALATSLSSYAADVTVGWSALDVTGISLAGGTTPVPSGDLMLVGYYTVAPTPGVFSLANFVTFGTGTMGQNSVPGFFDISTTAPEPGTAHPQIYIVAYNAATAGAATQAGIWTATFWGKPGIPTGADVPNSTAIDIEGMISNPGAASPTLAAGASIIFGGNPLFSSDFGGATYLPLQTIVPEPSTVALVGLGMLGMIGFIRRRRS